jgi:hypothetical protein
MHEWIGLGVDDDEGVEIWKNRQMKVVKVSQNSYTGRSRRYNRAGVDSGEGSSSAKLGGEVTRNARDGTLAHHAPAILLYTFSYFSVRVTIRT